MLEWTVGSCWNGIESPRQLSGHHIVRSHIAAHAEFGATVAYDDFVACGGETGAKDAGKMRSEGKDYVVQDGDVMLFRFNV